MKVELTKELFCNSIDNLEAFWRFIEKLNTEFNVDVWESPGAKLADDIALLLTKLVNRKSIEPCNEYEDVITYYMWELDFGKKYKPGCFFYNDKEVPLRNSEDLWNCIQLQKTENE